MTKLSVNINKVALLRNSRGKNTPDILKVAKDLILFGAHGITVHPRPDERHIRRADVPLLAQLVEEIDTRQNAKIEFNVEGYPSDSFLKLLKQNRPHQVTLVPDPPEALTSNAGWDFQENQSLLTEVCKSLSDLGMRTSLFLDPFSMEEKQWKSLASIPCNRVELYTESYADHYPTPERSKTLQKYRETADKVLALGLEINAGHDLNLENLESLIRHIPEIKEVSIGHALIGESLYLGFKETLRRYLEILKAPHGT